MSVQHVYQPKGLTLEQLLNTLQQQEGDKHWAAQELQLWLQRQQTPVTAQTASPLLAQWRDELGYLCDQLTLPDLKQAWLQLYSPVVHSLKSVSLDTHTDAKRFACLVDHLIHRTMAMIADEASETGLAQALRNCPEIRLLDGVMPSTICMPTPMPTGLATTRIKTRHRFHKACSWRLNSSDLWRVGLP